jgi:hypothetical protein
MEAGSVGRFSTKVGRFASILAKNVKNELDPTVGMRGERNKTGADV